MKKSISRATVASALVATLAAPAIAQTPAPARSTPSSTSAVLPVNAVVPMTGTVIGSAWKGDTTPYPQARIRLRDVKTGRGVARVQSDAEGKFRFERIDPGAYVVELLANDDKVLAVGDLFGVAAGGEVTTLVRLSSKTPWFGGFFGNAAAAVISAASTLGVTAAGSSGRPVSPQ